MVNDKSAPLRAVILDMDGILVDSEPLHVLAFRRFINGLKVTCSDEFLHSFIGFSIEENVRRINQSLLKGREIDPLEGVRQRDAIYMRLLHQNTLKPIPGIFELIEFCREQGLTLGLASSSVREQVDLILSRLSNHRLDLTRLFRSVVSGDDVPNKKPAADIYLRTLVNLNYPPGQCLAIEDSRAGVQAAKSAGLRCIALENQYASADRLEKADFIISTIEEAIPIIHHLIGNKHHDKNL